MNKRGRALLFSTLFVVCTLWTAHDAVGQSSKEQLVGAWTLAYFGTYSVNEPEKVINLKLAGTTFSNLLAGGDQKRIITSLTQDELKFTNPKSPSGVTLEVVWKRAK